MATIPTNDGPADQLDPRHLTKTRKRTHAYRCTFGHYQEAPQALTHCWHMVNGLPCPGELVPCRAM